MHEWCPNCQAFHIVMSEYEEHENPVMMGKEIIQHRRCSVCKMTIESHCVKSAALNDIRS